MTGPNDRHAANTRSTPTHGADPESGRPESALERAIADLIALPQEELLSQLDLKQAGDNIERFFECDRNRDCHNYSHEFDHVDNTDDWEICKFSEDASIGTKHDLPDPDPLDVYVAEVSGIIKWFDVSKGYGFIVPDNRDYSDVLLHVTCLRSSGHQTANEGARIRCEVLVRPRGWQAFRVLDMDESTAIHPALMPQRLHADVQPETDWMMAIIKWFNRVRGFGFAQTASGCDVFIHMETLRRFGFTELRPGEHIELRWGYGPKGPTAAALRPAGSHSAPPGD